LLAKKDYPAIYYAVEDLAEKKIIKIKRVGSAKVCELSLNWESISVLSFLDEQEALARQIPNMDKILGFKEFLDDAILVLGSYAKGKETTKSDIDLVVIAKEEAISKQRLLENLVSLYRPKVHPIVITQKDFVAMLLDKDPNLGKEIFANRLLFMNSSRYYGLIKEAIGNGFVGETLLD